MQIYFQNRFRFITLVISIFLLVSVVTRTVLLFKSISMVDVNLGQLISIYIMGIFYDFVAVSYLIIPFVVYLLVVPQKMFRHKVHRIITYVFTYILLYLVVFYAFSEWFFWNEFGVRFNFIAVDYLVYTTEVIGNIRESYPMGILLSVVGLIAGLMFFILMKYELIYKFLQDKSSFKQRVSYSVFYLLLPVVFFNVVSQDYAKISKNQYNNELAKAGLYSLFSAFRNNTLDYDTFYITHDEHEVLSKLKKITKAEETLVKGNKGLLHSINKEGLEKDYNIMMIVVESLSGEFLESLDGFKGLTPRLDALAKESLFFDKFYATGTRTIRGMESITLSVPPTAGRSIVKRPDNHNMFSSGFIFKNKGYETKFIYGGHGYFDNMNEFFSNNGFDIIDRNDFSDEEDTFHTIWGVCDENLMDKALSEADKSYKEHKPFMSFVMTTSNHRPYDFPDGRIDMPSHSGRDAAVKYTDFAIGKFIEDAKKKPWFKNTIFVVVADHCASSAGETYLPLDKYQIPLFIYAPEILKAQRVSKVSSQIDIMPTLFSLLNWSYKSKFYGQDILADDFDERALMGTYQLLGLYKNNHLSILAPGKKLYGYEPTQMNIFDTKYKDANVSKGTADEIISYYQGASMLHKKRLDRYDSKY